MLRVPIVWQFLTFGDENTMERGFGFTGSLMLIIARADDRQPLRRQLTRSLIQLKLKACQPHRMPAKRARNDRSTQRAPLPKFIQPQLATLVNSVPPGNEWLYEIKFDGYRILCRVENGTARFLTREAQDWTQRFNELLKLQKNCRRTSYF
jgi:bifunctional non-homologous end joining protein LigD